jgi:hypothetical protein
MTGMDGPRAAACMAPTGVEAPTLASLKRPLEYGPRSEVGSHSQQALHTFVGLA